MICSKNRIDSEIKMITNIFLRKEYPDNIISTSIGSTISKFNSIKSIGPSECPRCLMFFTLPDMMCFNSILDFALLHFGLNCLSISFSHYCDDLSSSCLWSLGVHLVSVNLWMYLAQQNICFQYNAIISFTLLFQITLLWMYSCNNIPIRDLSISPCPVSPVVWGCRIC